MRLVKLDIGNPVAFAPAQAGLFILALEGCRRASEQRRLHVLECVDADNVEAAVDLAGDHRHQATRGARVKLRRASSDDELKTAPRQGEKTIASHD